VRTKDGALWLTVPIKKHPLETPIKDITISDDKHWYKKQLKTLQQNYGKAKYFEAYYDDMKVIIDTEAEYVSQLNIDTVKFLFKCFEIKSEIIIASELSLPELKGGTEVTLEISKAVGADEYISGAFGKHYLDASQFREAGIKVTFHNFRHPVYKQLFDPFIPGLSAIDLLFNHGPSSIDILFEEETERLDITNHVGEGELETKDG
jgi:hypothetical protein